jgi:hypothetical protein
MMTAGQKWVWLAALLMSALGWSGCSKPRPIVASDTESESAVPTNSDSARVVPRRTNLIVISNVVVPAAPVPVAPTNNPPVVTCGPAQTFTCSSADGVQAAVAIHVEDPDGNALTIIWSADGRERLTQQLPAAVGPTSTNLTFSYNFYPGDHGVQAAVMDGAYTSTCETSVTVQKDTQDPIILCPKNLSVTTDPGQCSAIVTFQPNATDNCPDPAVVCDPPSGTAFPIGLTTVTCTATDVANNVGVCAFNIEVRVSNICPKMDTFWRQNPGAWPVNSLTLGDQVYTKSQLMSLLHAATTTDASVTLARQLIAASLNTAQGADPRPICRQLAQANDLLAGFSSKLPYRVNLSVAVARPMLALATELSTYNRAMVTPNCVP